MVAQLSQLRADWLALLNRQRAIAIIRAGSVAESLSMAKAASAGGLRLLEVAWSSSGPPAEMLRAIRRALPHCTVGAGSVLTPADLQTAIAAEAQFCFTPHTDPYLIQLGQQAGLPLVAGAMTPTEIVTAWRAGAASVKVFPISTLGNEAYLRSLRGPIGPIPLVPTGGVTSETAPRLIAAGAIAVGLSTALFPADEVARGDWDAIEARSRYLLALLAR
ncbi:MAG: bifunctional 4-hydroxy-2-oxoglutarate aldolase/2-dehydro-3-deoxy-phosphogluconate aldolase [Cyanobacteria bacterium J06554_11]